MSLIEDIRKESFKVAKDKNATKRSILQVTLAALKDEKLGKGRDEDLTEIEEVNVVRKEIKKLEEAIEDFQKGEREDLVKEAKQQKETLEQFVPEMMDEDSIKEYVNKKKEELEVEGMSGFGQLMGAVMKDLKGKADGEKVKEVVKKVLS